MSTRGLGDVSGESKLVLALVSGSEFVNHTYLVLLPPILGILSGDFGVSLALLGVAIGVRGGATVLCQLPFGYVSDRFDRTIGLGLSLGLGSLGTFLTALAPSFSVLLVGQAVIGVGVAGHHPSHFPLLSEAFPEEYRGRAFSIRGFAGTIGFGTPPLVTTIVLALPGTSWRHAVGAMGAFGLLYGIVALLLIRWYVSPEVTRPDPEDVPDAPVGASVGERVLGELRSIASMPAVLAVGLLAFVMGVFSNGFRTYIVVHLTDGYGLSLSLANLSLTGLFLVGAVMILAGGVLSDRLQAGTVMISTFAATAVLAAVVASLAVPPVVAVVLAILAGGGVTLASPARSKLVDRFSDSGSLGQSFAVMTVGMMLGGTVAPPVFGAVIDGFGLRPAFFGMAAVVVVALGLTVATLAVYDDDFSLTRRPATADD